MNGFLAVSNLESKSEPANGAFWDAAMHTDGVVSKPTITGR